MSSVPVWFDSIIPARKKARDFSMVVGRPIYIVKQYQVGSQKIRYCVSDNGEVRVNQAVDGGEIIDESVVGLWQRGEPGVNPAPRRSDGHA
jgi:hypothetical protein